MQFGGCGAGQEGDPGVQGILDKFADRLAASLWINRFRIAAPRLAKKNGVAQRRGVSGPLVIIIITLSSAID
jgi:hypothetical protein